MIVMGEILRVVSILFLEFIAITTLQNSFCHGNSDAIRFESEKNALLMFKNDLEDPSNRLSSWSSDQEDCCKWDGVVCDNVTGHVQELHLMAPSLDGYVTAAKFEAFQKFKLGGKINPSLLDLKYLSYLNLTNNNFKGIQIPKFLASMTSLRYFDLYEAMFVGMIPRELGNLSSLHYLRISGDYRSDGEASIYADDLQWLSSLKFITTSHLLYLNLSNNKFSGPLPLISSNAYELYLSNNSFSGNISNFLCDRMDQPNELTTLDLGKKILSGEIPNCWMNWPSLSVLKLKNNNLNGDIPSSIGDIKNLRSLHLRNNNLSGKLPLSLKNCTMLVNLDLGENEFVGRIPSWIGSTLSNLNILNVHSNKFNGEIPFELCRLSSLQILDLAYNKLSGIIPRCVNKLEAMVTKRSSPNNFYYSYMVGGMIENAIVMAKGREVQYDNILALVVTFDLSSNNLSGEVPEELTLLLELFALNLSNNFLTGRISVRIGDMVSLESLDLSRNQLSGAIPPSMSSLTFLSYLNLSYNDLSSRIPSSTQLQSFHDFNFVGNHLCGPPLTVNCSVDGETPCSNKTTPLYLPHFRQ